MLQQRRYWLIVCICLALILGIHQIAVYADAPNGQTTYRVNVRSRATQDSDVIAIFAANTPLNVTNRSDDSQWLLATNTTTMLRGWVNTRYVQLNAGLHVADLPVSSVVASAATDVPDGQTPQPTPTSSLMATAYAPPEIPSEVMQAAHLKAPVLPKIDRAMHASMKRIFARGQQLGNNPTVFSKVGDCMTDAYFLGGFGDGNYQLGAYTSLQDAVNYFRASVTDVDGTSANAFTLVSQASYSGLTAQTVLSDEFTSVKGEGVCRVGEPMLHCEYRVHKPSISVIMLGFSETQLMQPQDFDVFMRDIVQQTINQGVIPVLTTFPENKGRKQVSRLMNKVVVDVAAAYHIPLINLDRALYGLHDHGTDILSHLTIAPFGTAVLTAEGLRYGMNMRTLLTLQALDLVWKDLQKP